MSSIEIQSPSQTGRIGVAVDSKPSLKGEVFSALMRIATNADPDVQHVDKE